MWRIEPFEKSKHDRSRFDCGQSQLNEWFQKRASQWDKKGLSRTYVAVTEGDNSVLGYYALSSHSVTYDALDANQSHGLPYVDVPVVLLGRLAVDRSYRGTGLGRHLLLDALSRIASIADRLGIRAVEVDAIDDSAKAFYLKYGFTPLLDDEHHLFLPLPTIKALQLPPPG